jgi:hypothetical protein
MSESELFNNMFNSPSINDLFSSEKFTDITENNIKQESDNDDFVFNKSKLGEFNKEFERMKEETKSKYKESNKKKLDKLSSTVIPIKTFYNQSVSEIFIGVKDTWFNILDDVLDQNFSVKIFTKENRLFYIGISLIIICIILIVYDMFADKPNNSKVEKVEIHHVYHYDKNDMNKQIIKQIEDKILHTASARGD